MAEDDARKTARLFETTSEERQAAINIIGGTVSRSKALFDLFPLDCRKDSERGTKKSLESYKVALIPYRMSVSSRGQWRPGGKSPPDCHLLQEREFDHFDLWISEGSPISAIERWRDKVISDCTAAVSAGANFVVLSELAFPSFWPGRSDLEMHADDRRARLMAARGVLDKELQLLSAKREAVIVCGSYHDWDTFEHICPIYFPRADRSRYHKKRTQTHANRERIRAAHGASCPVYQANGRTFCVLLCTDAFDLTMFCNQLIASQSSNYSPTKAEIYFVPSFYLGREEQQDIRDACEQLSLATGQTVVLVNDGDDRNGCAVFVAGEAIELEAIGEFWMARLNPAVATSLGQKTLGMRSELMRMFQVTRRTILGSPQSPETGPEGTPPATRKRL